MTRRPSLYAVFRFFFIFHVPTSESTVCFKSGRCALLQILFSMLDCFFVCFFHQICRHNKQQQKYIFCSLKIGSYRPQSIVPMCK